MIDTERDLDRALAELFTEEHGDGGPEGHGDPEELAAYLAGELGEEEAERLRRHLEGCCECTALLLDLETLAAADEPAADGVADFELAAAWRTFEERRGAEEPAAAERPVASPVGRPTRWLQAAAAVLLLSTVGLSGWVVRLQQSVAELGEPQPNVPVLYLDATTRSEEAGDRPSGLELAPGTDTFLLMLTPTDPREFPAYEVEILGAGDEAVWRGGGLELSEYGSLRLGLSRRFLAPGEYRIRLYGIAGGARELVDDYRVEIR